MRAAVRKAFHDFSEPLEGRLPFMYLDSAEPRGLVTVGVGNLCPASLAISLPFKHADGARASRQEILAEWSRVEERQDLKRLGGGAFRIVTQLRLDGIDIDTLVLAKLTEVDQQLRGKLSEWEEFPADAQLACLSWAWAVGAHSPYPRMFEALRDRNFRAAAAECTINPQRGTIVLRNERNRALFRNAAIVVERGLDPETLYYPIVLDSFVDREAVTPLDGVPIVHALPTTITRCPRCHLVSCAGDCPEAA